MCCRRYGCIACDEGVAGVLEEMRVCCRIAAGDEGVLQERRVCCRCVAGVLQEIKWVAGDEGVL